MKIFPGIFFPQKKPTTKKAPPRKQQVYEQKI